MQKSIVLILATICRPSPNFTSNLTQHRQDLSINLHVPTGTWRLGIDPVARAQAEKSMQAQFSDARMKFNFFAGRCTADTSESGCGRARAGASGRGLNSDAI